METKSIPLDEPGPPPDYEDTNHPHYPGHVNTAHSESTKPRDRKNAILIAIGVVAFILAFTVALLAGIKYGLNHPRTHVPPGMTSTTPNLITVDVTQQVTKTVYPPGEDPIMRVTATTFVTMPRTRVVPSTLVPTTVPFETPQPAKLEPSPALPPPPPPSSAALPSSAKPLPNPWNKCPEPDNGTWDTKDECHNSCRLDLDQGCSLKDRE
ncbi:hypothetical protein BCR34DRAFT_588824 [Clohesyomyces aquaticus]|uniref:Uncharacterized protein n=1 Tax=Clohesyomyces aquaticus TaxID=1231657 RepID=A0A1Y1ZIU7_9PLEO|nr:hypothetical protein BCR34DRAFT_588824 [Clohesyomyces aquaticus]